MRAFFRPVAKGADREAFGCLDLGEPVRCRLNLVRLEDADRELNLGSITLLSQCGARQGQACHD